MTIVAEVGDLRRFATAPQLMAYADTRGILRVDESRPKQLDSRPGSQIVSCVKVARWGARARSPSRHVPSPPNGSRSLTNLVPATADSSAERASLSPSFAGRGWDVANADRWDGQSGFWSALPVCSVMLVNRTLILPHRSMTPPAIPTARLPAHFRGMIVPTAHLHRGFA